MKLSHLAWLVLAAGPVLAHGETLRCSGGIVSEGDSRISIVYKCGPPVLADTYCAPVFYPGGLHVVPEPWASYAVPCQPIEQWLYERGPGALTATIYLRRGTVQSIVYGRSPP
ncbi:hypothetical protein GCM10027034_33920 [Ramlibacter solisilvae]|uniref:DUF2845 domain-containing protein n=1 Tax=Ramlibacter tataouinensis TaxID=94132 RepID=A0A127JSL3_9BURK|nr:DUF2845 domain-containing protein [Ramlibacter tataouinensis]AMO22895.1 hypothetical protein UC35_08330 [Ramlibacter tataouinensis]